MPGSIGNESGTRLVSLAGLIDEPHAAGSPPLLQNVEDFVPFPHVDALAARVLQQNLIEARALHLKRVVEILLVQLLVLAEEERPQSRFAPPSPSASVLAHEVRLLDLLAHTQQPADPMNGAGQQRLADRIAWEMLPLEQQNPVATQGYERRNGRPAGTAADDDEIEVQPIHVHRSLPAP